MKTEEVVKILEDNKITNIQPPSTIQNKLKADNYVKTGDVIINTASMPLKEKGSTNMLKIHIVE